MNLLKNLLIFVGAPLTAVLGFTMYRYPKTWAKMNACVSRKDLKFDSPKQLAHTRRSGILFMFVAALELLSMLYLTVVMHRYHVPF